MTLIDRHAASTTPYKSVSVKQTAVSPLNPLDVNVKLSMYPANTPSADGPSVNGTDPLGEETEPMLIVCVMERVAEDPSLVTFIMIISRGMDEYVNSITTLS